MGIRFNATVDEWQDKGIANYRWGDVIFTPECRLWLTENVDYHQWYWDHYREEREVMISFNRDDDALLFKMTWL